MTPPLEWAARHGNEPASSEGESDIQAAAGQSDSEPSALPTAITTSAPTVAFGNGPSIAVPQLAGQTVRGVTEACSKLGLTPVLVGSGVAIHQNPAAGEQVPRGSRIIVRFGRAPAVVPTSGNGSDR